MVVVYTWPCETGGGGAGKGKGKGLRVNVQGSRNVEHRITRFSYGSSSRGTAFRSARSGVSP
jgi:hypothetical protein